MGVQEALIATVAEMRRNRLGDEECIRLFKRQLAVASPPQSEDKNQKKPVRADGTVDYRKRVVVRAGERFPTL